MRDAYNREIDYLRVSITDRCNLRCVYCMPESEARWIPDEQVMSYEEILRLCGVLSSMGIRKVKVTGGEPMTRNGVTGFIRELKSIPGIEQVSMTSNGILLERCLEDLVKSGLDALNISLDALDESSFRSIAGGNGLKEILSVIDKAVELSLPLKVNCVPVRELNYNQLIKVAALAMDRDVAVRFIELMPIGMGVDFQMVPDDEIRLMLEREFGKLTAYGGRLGNGPAVYWSIDGFKGKIGFISALSHAFCGSCNRLRLTADGFLKPCLYSSAVLDIKELIRGGAQDRNLKEAVAELLNLKPLRHNFESRRAERRAMYKIGG